MDFSAGIMALLGTIVGGVLSILGSVILEYCRQGNKRKNLAFALRGELIAIRKIIEQRGYKEFLRKGLRALEEGYERDIPILSARYEYFQCYKDNVANLGMLNADTAAAVTQSYTYARAFLEDVSGGLRLNLSNEEKQRFWKELLEILELADEKAKCAIRLIEQDFRC